MDRPTILFAGGGTGGHLFPGIAVADELRRIIPNADSVFAGSEREVECEIVATAGYDHHALSSPSSALLKRRPLRFLLEYRRACRQAKVIIASRQPAAVIGLGGFASVPLVLAARKLRVPIVLLEQNAVAGRATSRLARLADRVCHSFAAAVPRGRRGRNCVVTGNPVRTKIARLAEVPRSLELSSRPTLLILGGSQGSTAVNSAVTACVKNVKTELSGWRIVHQCGPRDVAEITAHYQASCLDFDVRPFFDDLPARYATADLVISRAGATTLAELACAGLPAALVPYPNAIRDHQRLNARVFADAAAAEIVEQQRDPAQTGIDLSHVLRHLLPNATKRFAMSAAMQTLAKPDAAIAVARVILETAGVASPEHCEPSPRPPHFETDPANARTRLRKT